MPKPMMMTIAIEEIAFGAVFRRIKNMEGVISLDILDEMEKPKQLEGIVPGKQKRFRGGGGIAKNGKGTDAAGTSAKCIVLSLIADHPHTSVELTNALEVAGKSRKTFANVSHHMRKDKLAVQSKTKKKTWTLTARGRKYLETECHIDAPI